MMIAILTGAVLALSAPDQATPLDLPLLAGAVAAPDCGNQPVLAGAWCISAPMSAMDGVVRAYRAELQGRGWLEADGSQNRALLVRRKDGGGCEAIQMLAVRDTREPSTADSIGYLGILPMPGDLCHASAGDQ